MKRQNDEIVELSSEPDVVCLSVADEDIEEIAAETPRRLSNGPQPGLHPFFLGRKKSKSNVQLGEEPAISKKSPSTSSGESKRLHPFFLPKPAKPPPPPPAPPQPPIAEPKKMELFPTFRTENNAKVHPFLMRREKPVASSEGRNSPAPPDTRFFADVSWTDKTDALFPAVSHVNAHTESVLVEAEFVSRRESKHPATLVPFQYARDNRTRSMVIVSEQPEAPIEISCEINESEEMEFLECESFQVARKGIERWLGQWRRDRRPKRRSERGFVRVSITSAGDEDEAEEDDADMDDFSESKRVKRGRKDVTPALLVHGPTGAGKSQLVYAAAQRLGFEVVEVNCGASRSARALLARFGEALKNGHVRASFDFGNADVKKSASLFLIDEADVALDVDADFWQAIGHLISISKHPVVFTSHCKKAKRCNFLVLIPGASSARRPHVCEPVSTESKDHVTDLCGHSKRR